MRRAVLRHRIGVIVRGMAASLHRYWLTFDEGAAPVGCAHGIGVTAWTLDDALTLIREALKTSDVRPVSVTEDVDVQTLDAGHVLPNMMPPSERGVWFPMGLGTT